MFAAGKTSGASAGGTPDPQFNYVTMLLHGDGTNGAQNNTFLDSSTNNFTITRNGNTTQGSFSPYGSNWSNYFGGTGNYLTTATSASGFSFGTDDFTIEFWINSTQTTRCDPIGQNNTFSSSGWWGLIGNLSSSGQLQWFENTTSRISATATNWNNGSWNHIAVTRSGNSVRMFVNGTQVGSTYTTSFTYGASNVGVIAGVLSDDKTTGPLTGYLSNFRIVKGTALYTGTFTPSTTPLTAVSGTSLLTCQANRFFDASTSALTITTTGTPSVQRFNPFGASTAYSTSVIGGSGYFDAVNDTLATPTSTALNMRTGAFQIDFWMYPTASPGQYMGPFGTNNAGGNGGIFFANRSGNLDFTNNYDTAGVISTPYPKLNQWHHIALVRNSSNVRSFYLNGVRVGSLSNAVDFDQTQFIIGAYNASFGGWPGYVSNFRAIIGANIADPTLSTIAVPTTPNTAVANTQLLLNFTNGAIFDNAMMNNLETVGNAQISTSVVKYGTGSLYFDGSAYLFEPSNQANTLGAGDFTIEAWIYPVGVNGSICEKGYGLANGFLFWYQSGQLRIRTYNGSSTQTNIFASSVINTDVWQHVAAVRSSGTITLYVNGTSVASGADTDNLSSTDNFQIGAYDGYTLPVQGYIDDFRITKYARYTTTFTPPIAAFPNIGPV